MLSMRHVTPFREEAQNELQVLSDTSDNLERWWTSFFGFDFDATTSIGVIIVGVINIIIDIMSVDIVIIDVTMVMLFILPSDNVSYVFS